MAGKGGGAWKVAYADFVTAMMAFFLLLWLLGATEENQRKGLADYPCKSAGMVEYPFFARAIDPRITTECVGCPPDPHPQGWFCAWKFTLEEG